MAAQNDYFHFANLASSAMAGVLGARMEYLNKETVWAYPTLKTIDEVINVTLDRESFFFRRLRCTASASRPPITPVAR